MSKIIHVENLNCPYCQTKHRDINQWATKPHRTHYCMNCIKTFEGTLKAVSNPTFHQFQKPDDINYISIAVEDTYYQSKINRIINDFKRDLIELAQSEVYVRGKPIEPTLQKINKRISSELTNYQLQLTDILTKLVEEEDLDEF